MERIEPKKAYLKQLQNKELMQLLNPNLKKGKYIGDVIAFNHSNSRYLIYTNPSGIDYGWNLVSRSKYNLEDFDPVKDRFWWINADDVEFRQKFLEVE